MDMEIYLHLKMESEKAEEGATGAQGEGRHKGRTREGHEAGHVALHQVGPGRGGLLDAQIQPDVLESKASEVDHGHRIDSILRHTKRARAQAEALKVGGPRPREHARRAERE